MGDARRDRFEAMFAEHFDVVSRFAVARAEPEAAKDAVAETFLAAWQRIDQLPAEPRGWLLVVARRKIADHYRAAGRRDDITASIAESTPRATPDHADGLVEADRVRAAFARLGPRDQEVLRLLAWDGLTRAEAAQVLGCSSALVAVRLHRARRRLREHLTTEEPAAEFLAHLYRSEAVLIPKDTS